MLSGYEIIVFSDELGRHPFSCQHIMKHFFATNRVVWVTPTGMRNPKLSRYDARRALEKVGKWIFGGKVAPPGLSAGPVRMSPPAFPYNDIRAIRTMNNALVTSRLKKELKAGAKRIVITTLPITAEYVDAFAADLIVYYIVDDFMEWPGVNTRYIGYLEKRLLNKAHLLIASAERLCQIKKGGSAPVLIPHGVEFEHFSAAKKAESPQIFIDLQRPVIGFFGAVSPWLDFKLIKEVAANRPEWSFVFIGPVDADITSLQELTNIHFPGKVAYSDLPKYATQFDVGIIPFVVNELTVSVNPLKLLEYFACGLPVVSTALPEVCKYAEHLHIANNTKEFIAGLERTLVADEEGKIVRQQIARENSWVSVAERFSAVIERSLAKP